jgi:hypothetical protein
MVFDWLHWIFEVGMSIQFRVPAGATFQITRRPDPSTSEVRTYSSVVRETIRDFLRKLPEGIVSLETITKSDGTSYDVKFEYHSSGYKMAVVQERIDRGQDHLCEVTPEGVIDVSTFKQPSIAEYFASLGPEYAVINDHVSNGADGDWLM